jgi:hypothetical protein
VEQRIRDNRSRRGHAAWPSAKGLELDEDSDAMAKCCESSRKDQVENLLFNTIREELKNSNKKRTCNCITSAVFIYIYDD